MRFLGKELHLSVSVLRLAGEHHEKHMPKVPEAPAPKMTGETNPDELDPPGEMQAAVADDRPIIHGTWERRAHVIPQTHPGRHAPEVETLPSGATDPRQADMARINDINAAILAAKAVASGRPHYKSDGAYRHWYATPDGTVTRVHDDIDAINHGYHPRANTVEHRLNTLSHADVFHQNTDAGEGGEMELAKKIKERSSKFSSGLPEYHRMTDEGLADRIRQERREARRLHDEAVKAGNVYSRIKFKGGEYTPRFIGALDQERQERPGGGSAALGPFLDHLIDSGMPVDDFMERYHKGDLHNGSLSLHNALMGRPTYRLSLRLAHLTGYRPRRHEYNPKPRATDLRESEWGKIHRYFPEPELGPKNRRTPVKVLLNASLFRLENNIPLRELEQVAPDFPPWGSVHSFEYRVSESGLWPTLLEQMGRSHLIPVAQKLIHGIGKAEVPDVSAKINVEGLPVA